MTNLIMNEEPGNAVRKIQFPVPGASYGAFYGVAYDNARNRVNPDAPAALVGTPVPQTEQIELLGLTNYIQTAKRLTKDRTLGYTFIWFGSVAAVGTTTVLMGNYSGGGAGGISLLSGTSGLELGLQANFLNNDTSAAAAAFYRVRHSKTYTANQPLMIAGVLRQTGDLDKRLSLYDLSNGTVVDTPLPNTGFTLQSFVDLNPGGPIRIGAQYTSGGAAAISHPRFAFIGDVALTSAQLAEMTARLVAYYGRRGIAVVG